MNKRKTAVYRYYRNNGKGKIDGKVKVFEYRDKDYNPSFSIFNELTGNKLYCGLTRQDKERLLELSGWIQYFSSHSRNDITEDNGKMCLVAIDRFMSNWENTSMVDRTSIIVLPLDTYDEFNTVRDNIEARSEMDYIGTTRLNQVFSEYPYEEYHIGLLDKLSASRFYMVKGFRPAHEINAE